MQTSDGHDAFTESLFDAMADDEGAEYWGAVYGQPIHNYSRQPDMTDEEYAAYVRAEMYKKTRDARKEEMSAKQAAEQESSARRERDRIRKKERHRAEREQERLKRDWEHGRKSREHREARQGWETARQAREQRQKPTQLRSARFQEYRLFWDQVQTVRRLGQSVQESKTLPSIRWPVISGRADEISYLKVKDFVREYADEFGGRREMVRLSRIFWHPDKIQQLYGQQQLGKEDLERVTAVFQVLDRIWKENAGEG